MTRRAPALLLLPLLLPPAAGARAAAGAIAPVPHMAAYALALSGSPDGSVVAASGHMRYEVRESCDAWATEQKLVLDSTGRDGTESATESDYATFETKNGRSFTFSMVERSNGHVADVVRGTATRAGDAGPVTARFSAPAGLTRVLPAGTLFPMAHNDAITRAATAGERTLSPELFDGTGTEGAQDTSVTVLSWAPTPAAAAPDPALAGVPSGRVHVAFYPANGTAMAPDYELGMRYFADGVSDRLDMDFGTFAVHGDLQSLHLLPVAQHCPR